MILVKIPFKPRIIGLLVLSSIFIVISGCTAKQEYTMKENKEELRQQILSGTLIEKDKIIKITTTDKWSYIFKVNDINNDSIIGTNVSIPINSIDRIEFIQSTALGDAGAVGAGVAIGVGLSMLFDALFTIMIF